ncbi:unnamed protein product [Spirodela intermedia]|uniref:Uncharacterized protein n=1 Tax=Spirodela intermedia TaxID=51605 RepID=A0A7I8KYV0_SPIIN|nr:unnamed protein product [Spirodela intermedia]
METKFPVGAPAQGGCIGGGAGRRLNRSWGMSLLNTAGLVFLTYSSAAAAYRARSDPWTLGFVVSAYITLMLLFWFLRAFEAAPPPEEGGAEGRHLLKPMIWLFSTTPVSMFTYRVASMMPFRFAQVIWATGALTTVACFYVLKFQGFLIQFGYLEMS